MFESLRAGLCPCEPCGVIESQLGCSCVLEIELGLLEAIGVLEVLIVSRSLHLGLISALVSE